MNDFASPRARRLLGGLVVAAAVAAALTGCSASTASTSGKVDVVGAENEYADVAAQIGGSKVVVHAVMSDPNTDPHTFEASPAVAKEIQAAGLVVQNGVGYDDFMGKLEQASPNSARKVVVAQDVLGLPASTRNPHLWYDPKTMPAVASAIAKDLGALRPADRTYFDRRERRFIASLKPWTEAIASFEKAYAGTPVAVTEPVADYMLSAAGTDIKTPWTLQAAIMNGTDPSLQNTAAQNALLTDRAVKVFLYNQQVTDPITQHFLTLAGQHDVPVVGVYETMPAGYHYQRWMLAEVDALRRAVTSGASTERL